MPERALDPLRRGGQYRFGGGSSPSKFQVALPYADRTFKQAECQKRRSPLGLVEYWRERDGHCSASLLVLKISSAIEAGSGA